MSDPAEIQRFFPPNRLAEKLQKAPPRTVEDCLNAAGRNLQTITSGCVSHVDDGLAELELALGQWPSEPDFAYLDSIYQISMRIVGVATIAGLADMDRAAKSLCDVVDGLIAKSLWEHDPVKVHVSALRLLRTPAALGAGAASVVDGLLQVRKRYAVPPPPPKPQKKD